MAIDLVEILKNSKNELLEAEGDSFKKWSSLKHNKEDFEIFLQFNIADIRFKPLKSNDWTYITCTSNTRFIKVYNAIKEKEKKAALSSTANGIHTKDSTTILTYDLIDSTYKTISLRSWEIVNCIEITEKNIELLDKLVNDALRKKKQK